ncbi:MAG: S-methyl-5'-thioadenosine phosphorylase [Planctomycetes bacterium]|nr:S-methyl-5'-thioadenosine phosphorylase [Planctomycetota bacterium]MCP4771365.1 S-methyl-5'-thioadenosine phosphorylase [Planctomycetota bacterium]MCP4861802.1 S-methyl-5'-thioadenosine phosphorylase [Planctomycetota bacterium]
MTNRARIGVIGGSGVYDMDGLEDRREVKIETPWGDPSDTLLLGRIGDTEVAFLPRHGRGHRYTPTEVPYLANIYALRSIGVQRLLSVSAVGSLCQEYAPGEFVMVDQFIDRTYRRRQTFFGDGIVAHVPMASPVSNSMVEKVLSVAADHPITVHKGGSYVCIEGPQFSTRAESEKFRSWGARIIGMTNATEAKLAREAGISFACIAMVTDYDCWHEGHDDVDVQQVIKIAHKNASNVRELVRDVVPHLGALPDSKWRDVLRGAVMTAPAMQPEVAKTRTAALFSE